MDFTIEKYRELLEALKKHKSHRIRHDVDLRPEFSLRVAQVEAEMGFRATYYFRSMHFESHAEVIKAIVALGHQAGYHYESLTTCKGDMEAAYEDFCRNLERLRGLVPVSTACAHGSPRSPYNSQSMWESQSRKVTELQSHKVTKSQSHKVTELQSRKVTELQSHKVTESQSHKEKTLYHSATLPLCHSVYDIHALGIEYEPMLDTDFSKTLYLTDTGRRWDGYKVSVRDKVPQYQEQWQQEGLVFHTTDDIIHALNDIHHPIHRKELLINTHPQRWMPFGMQWTVEAVGQWWKNQAKRLIVNSHPTPTVFQ